MGGSPIGFPFKGGAPTRAKAMDYLKASAAQDPKNAGGGGMEGRGVWVKSGALQGLVVFFRLVERATGKMPLYLESTSMLTSA